MEDYVQMEKQWESHPVRDFYHIYSDGTRVSVLFETPKDKVFARNLIAVLAFQYHIQVYCDPACQKEGSHRGCIPLT